MMLGPRDEDTRAFQQMAEALLAEDVALDDLLSEESGAHAVGDFASDDVRDRTPVTSPRATGPVPAIGAGVPATPGAPAAPASGNEAASVPQPMLDPYIRHSARYETDWVGSLRDADGIRPVRIFEVSEGGAVVQTPLPLEIGQELTLVFEQIAMQPQVAVKVSRRATLGFVVEGQMPPGVMAAATPPQSARRMAG